jgi:hypothetical protein
MKDSKDTQFRTIDLFGGVRQKYQSALADLTGHEDVLSDIARGSLSLEDLTGGSLSLEDLTGHEKVFPEKIASDDALGG